MDLQFFGIHDVTDSFKNIWSEDAAGMGSYEGVSCLNTYLNTKTIPSDHLIAWSDCCDGQKKNKNVVSFWYYIVHVKQVFMTVELPFPGHTFLPCGREFGVIEKRKRKTAAVYNPEGWFTLVEKSRVKIHSKLCT